MPRRRSQSPPAAPARRATDSASCHPGNAPLPLPRGDAAAREEPHGLKPGQRPLATLAGWFAVEETPLVKGSRVPHGYVLERRAGVGTVVIYEPVGILVWAEIVSFEDADPSSGSVMFFYLPVAHLRGVATDPLSYDSSILSWPDPKDEPAILADSDAGIDGLSGLGCLAVRLRVDGAPQPAERAVRFDCPAGHDDRPRAISVKTPKPDSKITASASAGPFTRRLVDNGVAVTRWNPKQRVWLAPRSDSDDD